MRGAYFFGPKYKWTASGLALLSIALFIIGGSPSAIRAFPKASTALSQSSLLAIRPAERSTIDVPNAPSPMNNSAQQPMQTAQHPLPQGNGHPPRINSSLGGNMKSHDREMAKLWPTDIDGLSLSSSANGGAQAIVSTQRTVKLESGVKIELRVTGQ